MLSRPGAKTRTLQLGRNANSGSSRTALPPGSWDAALLAANSGGRKTTVALSSVTARLSWGPRCSTRRRRRLLGAATLLVAAGAAVAPGSAAPKLPAGHNAAVPILMYHVIAPPVHAAPYPDLYVPAHEFAGQVAWLVAHGYHAVTLGQVFDYWSGKGTLPRRPVVLSFDDGYHSDYVSALPILRARGWAGVLNLEFRNLKKSWGLRPNLVRKLIAAGWEVDAHTLTHPDLTTLDPARLRREVAGSRTAIQREFGVPVGFLLATPVVRCGSGGRPAPWAALPLRTTGVRLPAVRSSARFWAPKRLGLGRLGAVGGGASSPEPRASSARTSRRRCSSAATRSSASTASPTTTTRR